MTMVENVARALHKSLGYEAMWPNPECTQCMDAARAAIEAMRQPSPAMRKAAAAMFLSPDIAPLYQAMIDAALSEPPAP